MQRLSLLPVTFLLVSGALANGWMTEPAAPVLCSTVVTNTTDSPLPGSGSLRAALDCANSNLGPDLISFNILASDPNFTGTVFVIRPLSGLPALLDSGTNVDGSTQTAFTGNTNAAGPEVVINGSLIGFSLPQGGGLHVFSGGNRIHSLVINGFSVSGTGIVITGPAASGNLVTGCYLGTNSTGLFSNPNSLDGITVSSGASNNIIGGTTAVDRNVMSGNTRFGILFYGLGGNPSNNVVRGNFIGTNALGSAALGNSQGVAFVIANGNIIGGSAAGAGNVISGNIQEAIHSNSSSNQRIMGNYIGTDVTGTAAIPNAFGINLFTGSSPSANNIIGGSGTGAGNVISGNLNSAIGIGGTGSSGNVIQGNKIGTDASGTAALGNQGGGIGIGTSGNLIGGTTIGARNVVSGNGNAGIVIFGTTSFGNVVQGNFVGTNAAGTAALGNAANGLAVFGAPNNVIGGTAVGAGNLFSGNGGDGILIANPTAINNQIQGNLVGTDAAGVSAIPNVIGIHIMSGQNVIGGSSSSARNVVSGNLVHGIRLGTAGATLNVVRGNFLGTDITGNLAVPNEGNGIAVNGGAAGNQIVGGNVTSGNLGHGMSFRGVGTFNNVVQGNYCGTNASGTAAIPNQSDGIRFDAGASDNLVGGTVPAARNIISSNVGHGLHIDDVPVEEGGSPLGTARITVTGNYIGTDATGTLPLGNKLAGVIIFAGAEDNVIGGASAGAGNVIAFTTGATLDDDEGGFITIPGDGITVADGAGNSDGNRISRNSIFSNNGLGIDLNELGNGPDTADGPTPNDPCDGDGGPNQYQNFPVISSVTVSGTTAAISGNLNSSANQTYTIEFFSNATADGSGHGEGKTFLGSTNVTTGPDCNAAFTFAATLPSGEMFVTATATDAAGNTSEFSAAKSPLAFDYLPAGSFVIGDQNAALGSQVTFWGSQWSSANQLSGGPAPASFRGFAAQTSTSQPSCGGTWSTGPGNSSNPPATVPEYMAVIVANSATKSGSTITGNSPKIVIVRTNPGYSPNPGHAGTGEVVAVLCE